MMTATQRKQLAFAMDTGSKIGKELAHECATDGKTHQRWTDLAPLTPESFARHGITECQTAAAMCAQQAYDFWMAKFRVNGL